MNLLKNNPSNQNFFREGSYIRRLVEFFELNSIEKKRWSAQKVTNVHLLLQVREKSKSNDYNNFDNDFSRQFEYWFHQQIQHKIFSLVNEQLVNVVSRFRMKLKNYLYMKTKTEKVYYIVCVLC